MQPEFLKLEQEYAECLWRVPAALIIILSASFFIHHINELHTPVEGRKDDSTQSNAALVGPVALAWLRVCAIAACARFAWIYFASADLARAYEIGKGEACCWLFYIGVVVPVWTWNEKERLLCVRKAGSRDI